MLDSESNALLLTGLLGQGGYRARRVDVDALAGGTVPGALLIADEEAARSHAAALLALKEKSQPCITRCCWHSTTGLRGQAGFDDVLRLPMDQDDMLARVRTFLRLRQQSEEVIEASQKRFRATLDLAPAGIVNLSAGGHLTLCDAAFQETVCGTAAVESARDEALPVSALRAGMITTRDLMRRDGSLLLSAEHVLNDRLIQQIADFEKTASHVFTVHVRPGKE